MLGWLLGAVALLIEGMRGALVACNAHEMQRLAAEACACAERVRIGCLLRTQQLEAQWRLANQVAQRDAARHAANTARAQLTVLQAEIAEADLQINALSTQVWEALALAVGQIGNDHVAFEQAMRTVRHLETMRDLLREDQARQVSIREQIQAAAQAAEAWAAELEDLIRLGCARTGLVGLETAASPGTALPWR